MRSRPGKVQNKTRLAERIAAAFGSFLIAVPVCLFAWFIFNTKILFVLDEPISIDYFLWSVTGLAIFSFLFPRAAPTVLGWLLDGVFDSARK